MKLPLRVSLLLLMLAVPSLTDAQEPARRNWVFSAEAGVAGSVPHAFCNKAWINPDRGGDPCAMTEEYFGLAAGFRLREWLHLDAVASLQLLVSDPTLPVGTTGNYIKGAYLDNPYSREYLATMLRAVIDPGTASVRPRAVLGVGYIPKGNVPQVLLGAGVSAGGTRVRFVFDFGVRVPRVRWSRLFQEYGSAQELVREWTETGTTTRRQFYGRVGVEF